MPAIMLVSRLLNRSRLLVKTACVQHRIKLVKRRAFFSFKILHQLKTRVFNQFLLVTMTKATRR